MKYESLKSIMLCVKPLLVTSDFQTKAVVGVFAAPLPIQLPIMGLGKQKMVQVSGLLLHTWETRMEFQPPAAAWPNMATVMIWGMNHRVSLSFSPSLLPLPPASFPPSFIPSLPVTLSNKLNRSPFFFKKKKGGGTFSCLTFF